MRGYEKSDENAQSATGRDQRQQVRTAVCSSVTPLGSSVLRLVKGNAQRVVIEEVRQAERYESRPHNVGEEMSARRNAADSQGSTEGKPGGERAGGELRTLAPPDPPSDAVEEANRTVTARERFATLASQRRWRIVPVPAELNHVPWARTIPVVLEDAVHQQAWPEHQAEQNEGSVSPPLLAPARKAHCQHGYASHHQGSRDPRRHLVKQRPRHVPGERPVVLGLCAVEDSRCR